MRAPRPAARTMALVGLTDISEFSRTVVLFDSQNHITAIRAAHRPSIAVPDDGCATSAAAQTSASWVGRLPAFFFLSPVFRKLTPTWSPLTHDNSQRRYARPVEDSSRKSSLTCNPS